MVIVIIYGYNRITSIKYTKALVLHEKDKDHCSLDKLEFGVPAFTVFVFSF